MTFENLLRKSWRIGIVFLAYFLTAKFGLDFPGTVSGFATLVWPPAGIALASVILWGYEMAIGVALGAFLINFITGAPFLSALGIMVGNTLEALLGAYLLFRFVKFQSSMNRIIDASGLIITALLATTVSATIGTASLFFARHVDWANFANTWVVWWIGDVLGILIATSFILAWFRKVDVKIQWASLLEGLLILALTVFISLNIFTNLIQNNFDFTSFKYLLLIPMIWAALRFKQRGVTLVIVMSHAIAIWGAVKGAGPFSGNDLTGNLVQLGMFMLVMSSAGLILASAKDELESTGDKYKKLSADLEEKVKERTSVLNEAQRLTHVGSWEWDIPRDKIVWTDELYRIFGLDPQEFEADYRNFLKALHPDDRDRIDKIIQESFRNGKPFEFEHRVIRPDGSVRVVYGKGEVITDSKKRPVKVQGIAQDITEIKNYERTLKVRNDELEKMNKFMVDRESKMADLKREIEVLKRKVDR